MRMFICPSQLTWVAIVATANLLSEYCALSTESPAVTDRPVTLVAGTTNIPKSSSVAESKPNSTTPSICGSIARSLGTKDFIAKLFDKYTEGNAETISRSMLDSIFNKLEIGNVWVNCDPLDLECKSNLGTEHQSSKRSALVKLREKRSIEKPGHPRHEAHWTKHLEECMKIDTILALHGLDPRANLTRDDFVRLCPALVQQVDSGECVHRHSKKFVELAGAAEAGLSKAQIWGYGLLAVTVVSLLSLAVISLIPCLRKSFYHKVMAYLVALAVGTLAGDAMLHLIPHAFGEGAISSISLQLSEEMELKQHYAQVWRACFVLVGIYAFFCVEQLMKIKAMYFGGSGHSHSHGAGSNPRENRNLNQSHAHGSKHSIPSSPSEDRFVYSVGEEEEKDQLKLKGIELVDVKIDKEAAEKLRHNVSCESDTNDGVRHTKEASGGHYHADDRQHHHHHGEKDITENTSVSSIAWMVIVGDGFHNFTDGLAIGVAFSASLSSGLSTAIAVFCHELPHELGDFAILINSGMTIKQAIIYNMVSAALAYLGLAVGILAGSSEEGRHFILSITAGLFLYISLADMLPELTHQMVPDQGIWASYLCQHLGILSGIAIMLIISLYEHAI